MATKTLARWLLLPGLFAATAITPSIAHAWIFNFSPTNEAVAAGNYHSCRVDSCGTIECWGRDDYGQSASDQANYVDVTVGDYHTCGLRGNGAVNCWGRSYEGQTFAPSGGFDKVDAGFKHTCGLRSDGTLTCWGDNSSGQRSAPAGTFLDVSAGRLHSCAVTNDGEEIRCWGSDTYGQSNGGSVLAADVVAYANETFETVSAGGYHTCARTNNDTVYCWGSDTYGAVRGRHPTYGDPIAQPTGDPGVYYFADNSRTEVSAGGWGTCSTFYDQALYAEKLECWGWPFSNGGNYAPPATVPGMFVPELVSVGNSHTCFMTEQDDIDCFGGNVYGSATVPPLPDSCTYEIDPFPFPSFP